MTIHKILERYGSLLREVDEWFSSCISFARSENACGPGCSDCCRGLFDITLLDAYYLKHGFEMLDDHIKGSVIGKARRRVAELQGLWPEFAEPYILNYRPEEDWEILMSDSDETPCPLLGDDGRCLVYDYRPMTCRLHGLPLVDLSGEVMHDEWCTLNFKGSNPLEMQELRWRFRDLFQDELLLFRRFTDKLLGKCFNELDTFISTAILIDFDGFQWEEWLKNSRLKADGNPKPS
jgi:Fe-S-cluster containining protein